MLMSSSTRKILLRMYLTTLYAIQNSCRRPFVATNAIKIYGDASAEEGMEEFAKLTARVCFGIQPETH